MILQTTYDEINDIISQKTKYNVKIDYGWNKSIDVTYTASFNVPIIGLQNKSFSANVKIVSVDNTRITADISTGNITGFILEKAKSLVKSKAPSGLIEEFDGHRIVLNLAGIPKLKAVFTSLYINSISVGTDVITVDASLNA